VYEGGGVIITQENRTSTSRTLMPQNLQEEKNPLSLPLIVKRKMSFPQS